MAADGASPARLGASPRRRYGASLARALAIADLRAIAHRRLPRFLLEYIEGGAEDEATLARNREVFAEFRFRPHTLRDISALDPSTMLFGAKAALPLAIAPTGFNGLIWPDGDLALARAAAAAGLPFTQSTVSNAPIAEVAAVPGLRHWVQLYVFGPDEVWRRLLAEAEAAGAEALVVTTDGQLFGNREWDRRNLKGPFDLTWSARLDLLRHPGWLRRGPLRHGLPRFPNVEQVLPELPPTMADAARAVAAGLRRDLDWRLIASIRAAWPGRLLVKGVLRADDALLALEAGCDGLVLSNHGGRQLDRAVSALEVLPEVRAAVGGRMALLVDGGFRRGGEIALACALGADAVMVGRAALYGLAAGGEAGAARALAILGEEFTRVLGLLGASGVGDLGPGLLAPASRAATSRAGDSAPACPADRAP